MTYQLNRDGPHPSIKCLICGAASYSQGDIDHLYCGRCKRFHLDEGSVPIADAIVRIFGNIPGGGK